MRGDENANNGLFSMLLRQYRVAAGMTQEELSAAAGLSVRAISYPESGHTSRPYLRSVRLLADALALADSERSLFIRAARGGGGASNSLGEQALAVGRDGGAVAEPPVAPAQLPPDISEFTPFRPRR